jgi:hypothetical protein
VQPTVRAIGPLIVALIGPPLISAVAQVPKGVEGGLDRLPAPRPVVAQQLADGRIQVTWGSVLGAESYLISKSVPPAGIRVLAPANPGDTVYLDSDVKPGSTYYYSVATVGGDGGPGLKTAASPVTAAGTPPVTAPALAAPATLTALAFPPPYVTLHWSYPTGDVEFIVERALLTGTATSAWQVRLRTGKLPCCFMNQLDRGDDLPATQRAVYRVTAVDPASPSRNSPPTMSPELSPGSVRTNYPVSPDHFWLPPNAGYIRTLRVGHLGGIGFIPSRPSRRILSLDESIVSINTTDGLYRAKSPGVTYVFTLDLEPTGQPYVMAERVIVVP